MQKNTMAASGLMMVPIAFLSSPSQAHDQSINGWSTSRPNGHAPIGVMGDHTH